MKKMLLLFIMAGLMLCMFVGCLPTTPTEGEPEPSDRVVMIELFIAMDCSNCKVVEPILEQLVEEYGYTQTVLVEEAVNWSEYTTPEISNRYDWYFPPPSDDRGIPNILFNGLNENWIHGASNYQNIKNKIEAELTKDAKIIITASQNQNINNSIISGTVKNVSDIELSNLEINGMIFIERDEENLKYSVTDIFDEQKYEIITLSPEETYEFSFILEGINWSSEDIHGVVFVQAPNSASKEILQACYVE